MARWEPNARGRLRDAALDLFTERGYEQTTVQEIAERAGLTARTFFRHYADKREVLFGGSEALEQAITEAVAAAPPNAPPMELVAAALDGIAALIGRDRAFSRRRQAVIDSTTELQERELIKLARLAAVLRGALRERGVPDAEAAVAAETAIAIVRAGFDRWRTAPEDRPLADVLREALGHLEALLASS
jgi:AcrR family transcriptional regulator